MSLLQKIALIYLLVLEEINNVATLMLCRQSHDVSSHEISSHRVILSPRRGAKRGG